MTNTHKKIYRNNKLISFTKVSNHGAITKLLRVFLCNLLHRQQDEP